MFAVYQMLVIFYARLYHGSEQVIKNLLLESRGGTCQHKQGFPG